MKTDKCSFCGSAKVDHLIGGLTGFICDECIEVCRACINEVKIIEKQERKNKFDIAVKTFLTKLEGETKEIGELEDD